MTTPTFGDLRSLLQRPPSEACWRQLCTYSEEIDETTWYKAWWPYIRENLSRQWPDTMRVSPKRWLQRVCQGEDLVQLKMVRALTLTGPQFITYFPKKTFVRTLLQTLDRSKHLTESVHLSFNYMPFGYSDVTTMLQTRLWNQSTGLDMTGCNLHGFALGRLLDHKHSKALTHLCLCHNELNYMDWQNIAQLDAPLTFLDLSNNSIHNKPQALHALRRSTYRPHIKVLRLHMTHSRPEHVEALTQSEWPQMEVLTLHHNPIGDPGVERLIAAHHDGRFPQLHTLNLNNTALSEEMITHLRTTPLGQQLTELSVAANTYDTIT